jgi:hypothetical protein
MRCDLISVFSGAANASLCGHCGQKRPIALIAVVPFILGSTKCQFGSAPPTTI